jgi:hypothetical protein
MSAWQAVVSARNFAVQFCQAILLFAARVLFRTLRKTLFAIAAFSLIG